MPKRDIGNPTYTPPDPARFLPFGNKGYFTTEMEIHSLWRELILCEAVIKKYIRGKLPETELPPHFKSTFKNKERLRYFVSESLSSIEFQNFKTEYRSSHLLVLDKFAKRKLKKDKNRKQKEIIREAFVSEYMRRLDNSELDDFFSNSQVPIWLKTEIDTSGGIDNWLKKHM